MSAFDSIIQFILAREGGYVDDPKDPGGETNFGISKHEYPNLDIKNLTQSQAIAIYQKDYWKPEWEALGLPLAACMMDTCVNMGLTAANHFLDTANGSWQNYIKARAWRYEMLVKVNPQLSKFSAGWNARLNLLSAWIEANEEHPTAPVNY